MTEPFTDHSPENDAPHDAPQTNGHAGNGAEPAPVTNGRDHSRVAFTIYEAHRSRLSKQYTLAPDGSVVTNSGTQFATGKFRVVEIVAPDACLALAEVGAMLDALTFKEAIGLGVPSDGSAEGQITTKGRFNNGNTVAIPRSLDYFRWPEGAGLLLIDGDGIDGLQEVACELYPPFKDVAFLTRASASASVIDPSTGKRLKAGEHAYVIIDDPSQSEACLDALMRLAWLCGRGWLMLSKRGDDLIRGPVDTSVGSPERLSYEGAAVIGDGIVRLPRAARVTGGSGVLRAAELLAYADQHAPDDLCDVRIAEAKADPAHCERREQVRAAYRDTHIEAAVARGIPREKAEATYDASIAAGSAKVGKRTFLPLTNEHVLYWPTGQSFTVADIVADPRKYHGKECADPIEGMSYQTLNCALINTDGIELVISDRRVISDLQMAPRAHTGPSVGERSREKKFENEKRISSQE